MINWLKGLDVKRRRDVEAAIRQHTSAFSPPLDQRNAYDKMSWDDLKNLDEDLITIGSHTTNHVITKALDNQALKFKIAQSRALLEKRLGRPTHHFCYSNGYFDRATINVVKSTYQSAVTTDEGVVS